MNQNPTPVSNNSEDEIDLVELFLVIWSKKIFIVGFTLLISALTAAHQMYIAPEIFKSDAVILPVSASSSGGMLSQLGGLASFVGIDAPKSENTIEVILKSRSFAQDMVEKYKLKERWELKSLQDALKQFSTSFELQISKKDPTITVAWEDKDPVFAQQILRNALDMAQQKMAEHTAKKKSIQVDFLENRVKDSQKEMMDAEEALRKFQEQNKGIEIERQAEALIMQLNALKTEHQAKEVELEVSKKMLNPSSREITVLGLTLEQLKKKIDSLIGEAKKESEKNNLDERSLMDIPKIGLEYARHLRQVKINQKIYGLLVEQLEMAKIEAQKNVESFEVIDSPLVPEKRIKPKRSLTVAIAGVCAGMLAVMLVLLARFIKNIREDRKKLASNPR